MKLAAGTILQNGKYLLNHAIGREAFSLTYRATQNGLLHPVIIKTLHPSLQASASFAKLQERFIGVTRQLARSQHPSLVRILDFFQEDGLPFMVMECVPGNTMTEVIQAGGRILKPEAIHYIRQIGVALSLIHDRGFCHGNIKPQNIVRRQGTNLAVLVGFGISHELALAQSPPNQYGAPERTAVVQPTPAIDLYALSATLSYLVTGYPLGTQDFSPVTTGSQSALEQAIVQGLARDPQHRPPSVAAWLELLPADTLPLMLPKSSSQPITTPTAPSSAAIPGPTTVSKPKISQVTAANSPQLPPAPSLPTGLPRLTQGMVPPNHTDHPAANGHHATPVPMPSPVPRLIAVSSSRPSAGSTPAAKVTLLAFLHQRRILYKFGLGTAVAGAIGGGFGLALRFSAAKNPGFSFLNPNQTFSDRPWQRSKTPTMAPSDIPVEHSGGISDVIDPLGEVEPVQHQHSQPPTRTPAAVVPSPESAATDRVKSPSIPSPVPITAPEPEVTSPPVPVPAAPEPLPSTNPADSAPSLTPVSPP